jgi:competence/damage-inducible protein CinA-like protein
LATIGIDVYFHTVVGDNRDRIVSALRQALGRSGVVVVTGGLGPTPDDITAEAIAFALDRSLVRDERLCTVIEGKFAALGRTMPEDNLKQADLPGGATIIEPEGTAPGFYLDNAPGLVFALPGVPWEMEAMLEKTVLPVLAARSGASTTLSREILVLGLGESHTHATIKDLVAAQGNPTIGYLAGKGQVRVRLTAKAADAVAARALIEPVEAEIRARLGEAAVAGAGGTLATRLGTLLRERGESVATAESLTGGLLAAELTEAPGASQFFVGAIVAYATASKIDIVGVPAAVIDEHGPVSEATARALADGAVERLHADLGLSATGVAGPESQDGHPPGTVFVGVSYRGETEARLVRAYGDRSNVQGIAVTSALDLGRRVIERVP